MSYQVIYIKDGKQHAHTTTYPDLQSALACAHELTRDWVADFTRVHRLPTRYVQSPGK